MVSLSLTASEGFLRLKSSLGSGCSLVLGVGLCVRPLGAWVRPSLGVGAGSASLRPHTGQSWEQQEALQQQPARARVCSVWSALSGVLRVPALAAPPRLLASGQVRNHHGADVTVQNWCGCSSSALGGAGPPPWWWAGKDLLMTASLETTSQEWWAPPIQLPVWWLQIVHDP